MRSWDRPNPGPCSHRTSEDMWMDFNVILHIKCSSEAACVVRCHEQVGIFKNIYRVLWHWAGEHIGSIIEPCVFFYLFQCNTMTAVPLLWVCRLLWPAAPSAVNSVEQITLMPHNHSYITHTLILCFDFRFSSLNSQTALLSNQTMQHCGVSNIAFSFHQPSVTNKVFCHVCGSL